MSTNTKGTRPPFQGIDMFSTALPFEESQDSGGSRGLDIFGPPPVASDPIDEFLHLSDPDSMGEAPGSETLSSPPQNCAACGPLFAFHRLKDRLPPADCFEGEGLGMWFDSFLEKDGGYAPWTLGGDSNRIEYCKSIADTWASIGVKNFIYTGTDEKVFQAFQGKGGVTVSAGMITPFVNYERAWSGTGSNPQLIYSRLEIGTGCALKDPLQASIYAGSPVVMLDEICEIILEAYLYRDAAVGQAKSFMDTHDRSEVMAMFKEYIRCIIAAGKRVYLSSYSVLCFEEIQDLLKEFPDISIMPDSYYRTPTEDRFSYWEHLSRMVPNPKQIKPFLSTTCNQCITGGEAGPDCSPANLICDMMNARRLGFGSPYFYISDGVEQRFWDATILGTWLMGCHSINTTSIARPQTYGDLQRWLCALFPVSDTSRAQNLRQALIAQLNIPQKVLTVMNNPVACVPCVMQGSPGDERKIACRTILPPGRRCDNISLPCCPSTFETIDPGLWKYSYYDYLQSLAKRGGPQPILHCFDVYEKDFRVIGD